MPFVVIIDQHDSQRVGTQPTVDLVMRLNGDARIERNIPFSQSAGDEVQGLVGLGKDLVEVLKQVAADAHDWSVGVGIGRVTIEAGGAVHRSSGEAFVRARKAVEEAKRLPWGLAVRSGGGARHEEYETALHLWWTLLGLRTPKGWRAAALRDEGRSLEQIGLELGVSKQSVSKTLRAAHWQVDHAARPVLARLGDAVAAEALG